MKKTLLSALLCFAACGKPAPKADPFGFDAPTPTAADFSQEETLLSRWNDARDDSLRRFWNSGIAGTFTGVGGVEVAFRIHRATNPKAAVVITPGRTESIIKYAEVARDLTLQGYSTFTLTLRGQGEAGRILANPDPGYVDYFDDYVTDTHQFIADVVNREELQVFSLAHSTSGAVMALLLIQFPTDIDAFVTTSPMLEINLGAYPPPVASTLANGFCSVSDGTGYVLGAGPYTRETDFEKNSVTHSRARFDWKIQQLDDDPSLRLGGTTWRWLCQSLEGSSRAAREPSFTPTLIFQAGADTIVKPGGQEQYCDAAKNCTLVKVEGAKHELLQETDEIRNEVLAKTVKFFDAQVTK